jgi:hypothetical protein
MSKAPASEPKDSKPARAIKETVPEIAKEAKRARDKLLRDSFTIPASEYAGIDQLKRRAATLGHPIKKSEALRAGIKALTALPDDTLLSALRAVPSIKTGRPKGKKEPKDDAKLA